MRALIVSPKAFARQMGVLRMLGYRGLSMTDLAPYLRGEKQGKVVGLTFDDGYQNNLTHALPILRRNGFTATCYGVSRAMGGTNAWDAAAGAIEKPLMTIQDWKIWRDQGMDIGSHTQHHANLQQCEDTRAWDEIAGSRQDLEMEFGCKVMHFCYPYGWFESRHIDMVRKAGYETATTTQRGRASPGDDMYTLKRIKVARATSLPVFLAKIASSYEDTRP